jgi:hypothetical protein
MPLPDQGSPYASGPASFPEHSSLPPHASGPAPLPEHSSAPQQALSLISLPAQQRSAQMSRIPPWQRARRLPFVLGGLVVVGAGVAIGIVLAAHDPGSQAQRATSDASVLAAPDATAIVDAAEQMTAPMAAGELEAECRGYQVDRKWAELAQCAAKLKPLDPKRAAELGTRAAEEARSAPRIEAIEAALRDKDLKRAKSELDQVWAESVEHAQIKRTYEVAEAQAITALAAQLERVRAPGCQAYNELLEKQRAVEPEHVTVEAARRMPCPTAKCDADALAAKGLKQFSDERLGEALASFEMAFTCNPDPSHLQKMLLITCKLGNLAKARSYWKRLSPALRTPVMSVCVGHGFTEERLKAP